MLGLYARKVGMTQVFDDSGNQFPVTVIRIEPNVVLGTKTKEADGYSALIVGIDEAKENRITKPYKGQFSKISSSESEPLEIFAPLQTACF